MTSEINKLKQRISSEFHITRIYSIESKKLIETLQSSEEGVLKEYSELMSNLQDDEIQLISTKGGKGIHLSKDVAENIVDVISNKLSMTQQYVQILNCDTSDLIRQSG